MISLDQMRDEVVDAGGLRAYDMREIREATGIGRLGSDNVKRISKELEAHGLGHVPAELPTSQREQVRLYAKGKPVGKVIEAVLQPNTKSDEYLLNVANQGSAAEVIDKIRALVDFEVN